MKSRSTERFTIIPNDIAQNKELCLEARGMLLFLLSLPSDWVIYKSNLHEHLGCAVGTADRVFAILQKAGYIISVKNIDSNGFFIGWEHVVYNTPTVAPSSEMPENIEGSPTGTNTDIGKSWSIQKKDIPFDKELITLHFSRFINFLNSCTGKRYRGTDRVKASLSARLKEGYTMKDIEKAITNASKDDYHISTGFKYVTPEFVLRPDKLDRFTQDVTTPSPNAAFKNPTPSSATPPSLTKQPEGCVRNPVTGVWGPPVEVKDDFRGLMQEDGDNGLNQS